MPERPLLVLPRQIPTDRITNSPAFAPIQHPSPSDQSRRLGKRFERLNQLIERVESGIEVSLTPDSLAPDRVIVFELAQPLSDFAVAARSLGFEWLGEEDLEVESDEFFFDKGRPNAPLSGRMYLAMPDVAAMKQLLSYWKMYEQEKELPYGTKAWVSLFSTLKEVRPWGPKDRLPAYTKQHLQSRINVQSRIRLELEFFWTNRVPAGEGKLKKILQTVGGSILDRSSIDEIRYIGLLVDLPIAEAIRLIAGESELLDIEELMHVVPQVMSVVTSDEEIEDGELGAMPPTPTLPPVAALLDGVPLQNHELLQGRVIIEDSLELERISPASSRHHGTSMASLIIHGDLQKSETPIRRPLVVHPVLTGNDADHTETTPPNKLLLDVIYRAVIRVVDADGKRSGVKIINLSMGDTNRPFTGSMSAWARLVDFLSWRYSILFIVSAGNVDRPFYLVGCEDANTLDESQIEKAVLRSLQTTSHERSIISPAEAINALTVGAAHADGCEATLPNILHAPITTSGTPNVISCLGLGYRRAIKPDIIADGGRVMCISSADEQGPYFEISKATKYFGQMSACPGGPGDLDKRKRTFGTSNAAALATRGAIFIYDVLDELRSGSGHIEDIHMPVLIKALLVHSASWGEAGKLLDGVLEPRDGRKWSRRRENVSRFLGYGGIDIERVLECTKHRATMIGCGEIEPTKANVFSFPLPPSLSSVTELRRLTITTAWITPIAPGSQNYRRAIFELMPNAQNYRCGVKRLAAGQPTDDALRRGTVIHEVFEGNEAVPFVSGSTVDIRLQCRASSVRDRIGAIPYGMAISFEVGSSIKADIYNEIRNTIRPRARIGTS